MLSQICSIHGKKDGWEAPGDQWRDIASRKSRKGCRVKVGSHG